MFIKKISKINSVNNSIESFLKNYSYKKQTKIWSKGDIFPGYTIYGKEAISRVSVGHDNSDNAYCKFYAGVQEKSYSILVSKSHYDPEKNILHLYRKL
jgi:hypothetical protein